MLSQKCPDNVFFNSRKSDLEGQTLAHVSILLEKNCSINIKITKYECLKDVHFFAYSCQDLVYTRVQN